MGLGGGLNVLLVVNAELVCLCMRPVAERGMPLAWQVVDGARQQLSSSEDKIAGESLPWAATTQLGCEIAGCMQS